MAAVLLFICFAASSIGAIVGAGGGVIIKPVVDALGIMPVGTVSFLSSCTVFVMSCSSLLRSRRRSEKINYPEMLPLACGSVCGGLSGKLLFDAIRRSRAGENLLGGLQSLGLLLVMLFVLIYISRKDRIASYHLKSRYLIFITGLALGLLSAFLGIGGGPYNVAALFLLFSMDAKKAAHNSMFIILFSQASSILYTVITGSIPEFRLSFFLCMAAGGVLGGMFGAFCSAKIKNQGVEKLLKALILVIMIIAVYNAVRFFI